MDFPGEAGEERTLERGAVDSSRGRGVVLIDSFHVQTHVQCKLMASHSQGLNISLRLSSMYDSVQYPLRSRDHSVAQH